MRQRLMLINMLAVAVFGNLLVGCGLPGGHAAPEGDGHEKLGQMLNEQSFPFCAWLDNALSESEKKPSIMIESTYVLADPVASEYLVTEPAGQEQYDLEANGVTKVSCVVRGFASDPDYGHQISANISVSLEYNPAASAAPGYRQGLGSERRAIKEDYVILDPQWKVRVSEFYGNASTDYAPFFEAIINYWDRGDWGGVSGAADGISEGLTWDNALGVCRNLDRTALNNMFRLDATDDDLYMEAKGYGRSDTLGAISCTFKREKSNTSRVEIAFERMNSAGDAVEMVNDLGGVCSASSDGVVLSAGRPSDCGIAGRDGLESYKVNGAIVVIIRSYFWRDYVPEDSVYVGYLHDLHDSVQDVLAKLPQS